MDLLASLAFFMFPVAMLISFTLALSLVARIRTQEQARIDELARQNWKKAHATSKFRRKRL